MRTPYSIYDEFFKSQLDEIHSICGISGPTDVPPPLVATDPPSAPFCGSGAFHTSKAGDTCSSIALQYSVPSAAVYTGNQQLFYNCSSIPAGLQLCLPLSCTKVYSVQPNTTCRDIEIAQDLTEGYLRRYNPWLAWDCSNLQTGIVNYGNVLCLSPQGGTFGATGSIPGVTAAPRPGGASGSGSGSLVPTTARLLI